MGYSCEMWGVLDDLDPCIYTSFLEASEKLLSELDGVRDIGPALYECDWALDVAEDFDGVRCPV